MTFLMSIPEDALVRCMSFSTGIPEDGNSSKGLDVEYILDFVPEFVPNNTTGSIKVQVLLAWMN